MPHTPEAQAIIDRRERERLERWNGERRLFDTAYTRGDHLIAEPGAECWSRTAGDIDKIRVDRDGEALGGIILDITTAPDRETGELRRAYRCFDPYVALWRAVTVLREEQVDPGSFSPPDWTRIRGAWRRVCREVGVQRGAATRRELELVQTAARLAAILGRTLA